MSKTSPVVILDLANKILVLEKEARKERGTPSKNIVVPKILKLVDEVIENEDK